MSKSLRKKRKDRKAELKAKYGASWRTVWKKERKDYGGSLTHRALAAVNKANPLTMIIRNGYLGVLKINGFNWALKTKLIMDAAAKGNAHAKKVMANTYTLFEGFGGDRQGIENNVRIGWNKRPIFGRYKKVSSLTGEPSSNLYGGDDLAAYVSAASSIIVPMAKIISSGASIYKSAKGVAEYENQDMTPAELAAMKEDAENQIDDSEDLTEAQKNSLEKIINGEQEVAGMSPTAFVILVSGLALLALVATIIVYNYFRKKQTVKS